LATVASTTSTRDKVARLYRPTGPKFLKTVLLSAGLSPAGSVALLSGPELDLTHPIEGFRIVLKLRDVIGTANMTSANPLGYLNMIQRILFEGRNERKGGKASLWDIDLGALALFQSAFGRDTKKPWSYNGVLAGAPSAGTELPFEQPSTPVTGFFTGVVGTYDIRIAIDLPSHPFGAPPYTRPGYVIRAAEWKDSLYGRFQFPAIPSGTTHALGTDAGTTTHTFSSYGSGAGAPTLDIYALPVFMGAENDAATTPGFLSRIALPVTVLLQSAGGVNTSLLTLEKTNTTRIAAIIGVSSLNPFFSALSDTNMTTMGVFVAKNRVVRENDDIFAHKAEVQRNYANQPIQGLVPVEFMHANNPDAAYPAETAADGTTYEIRGTVAGVANALGTFIQEVEAFKPMAAHLPQ
jgi:hypothetical protein